MALPASLAPSVGDDPHVVVEQRRWQTSSTASTCAPLLARTAALLDAAGATGRSAAAHEEYEPVLALSWAVDRFGDDEAAARRRVTTATAGVLGPAPRTPRRRRAAASGGGVPDDRRRARREVRGRTPAQPPRAQDDDAGVG